MWLYLPPGYCSCDSLNLTLLTTVTLMDNDVSRMEARSLGVESAASTHGSSCPKVQKEPQPSNQMHMALITDGRKTRDVLNLQ